MRDAMKVTILCGVPGSGKSALARELKPDIVCSADDFFMTQSGEYRFDPSKLGEAHAQCLRKFAYQMVAYGGNRHIVVDNTNTTVAEIAPYAALALAYGYELDIVTVKCSPEKAHARNQHGVPFAAVQAMAKRLDARELPPYWPHRTVETFLHCARCGEQWPCCVETGRKSYRPEIAAMHSPRVLTREVS